MNLAAATRMIAPTAPTMVQRITADAIFIILFLLYSVTLNRFSTMPPKPMKDRLVIAAASRVMGRPLKGAGGITGLHALAHAAEHDHSQHEADACADGTDQSLDVGSAEAQSLDVCAVVIDDQNGDSQNAAVGGDQGQVDARELYSATTYFFRKISMNCTRTAMTRMNTMVCR